MKLGWKGSGDDRKKICLDGEGLEVALRRQGQFQESINGEGYCGETDGRSKILV